MSDVDLVVDLMKQWTILADHTKKGGPIRPKTKFSGPADRNYQLKGKVPRKFLQWEEQNFGINIGWTDDAEPKTATRVQRWFFMRNGENETPITYGEKLAIGNGKPPSWLCYGERTWGVNLNWRDDPSFEWKVLGGEPGEQVKLGDWVALYNMKDGECLIYFARDVGAYLGWPTSKTWGQQFKDKLGDLAGDALDKALEAGVQKLMSGGG